MLANRCPANPHARSRVSWLSIGAARGRGARRRAAATVGSLGLVAARRSRLRQLPALTSERSAQLQQSPANDPVPPGCRRYSVELRKPLGMVLEEDRHGAIYVAEIQPEGNAERAGVISKGDMLVATTGYTYTREQAYNDVRVRSGEQLVRLNVRNEDFNTVLAAIRSHPGHVKVRMDFQRCNVA